MNKFEEVCSLMNSAGKVESTVKSAWSDLVKKYPGKWILYTDIEVVDDERLFLCTVLEVYDDSTRSEKKLQYLSKGIKAVAMRTTSDFNGFLVFSQQDII